MTGTGSGSGDARVWPPRVPSAGARYLPTFAPAAPDDGPRPEPERDGSVGRRRFLLTALGVGGVAVVGGIAGGWLVHELWPTTVERVDNGVTVRGASTFAGSHLDVATVVAKVEPSVVSVQTTLTLQRGRFASSAEADGTGIVLSEAGLVLTNEHVVDGATAVTVTLAGSPKTYDADVAAADKGNDLALLQLRTPPPGLRAAQLGRSSDLAVGDEVVAIGNALGLGGAPSVTRGIISALDRTIDTEAGATLTGVIQTDAAISSGNSGGPLVNASGEIVGINTAVAGSSGTSTAENVGFAISIDNARKVVDRLRASPTATTR
jgi:putative serine protease PepD